MIIKPDLKMSKMINEVNEFKSNKKVNKISKQGIK